MAVYIILTFISVKEINKFIMEIPCISNTRKKFYKEIINFRYDIIKCIYDEMK